MAYFSNFPKLLNNKKIVSDILSRVAFREELVDKIALYYPYYLKEEDTPEIIASKYYKDPSKDWLVLFVNNMMDPFFDFPLSHYQFEKYLNIKYKAEGDAIDRTGTEYAQSTINIDPPGYRAVITSTNLITGESNTSYILIDHKAYVNGYGDPRFDYSSMTSQYGNVLYQQDKETFTIYDYELEQNEAKRHIKLLRKEYVNQVESEFNEYITTTYE